MLAKRWQQGEMEVTAVTASAVVHIKDRYRQDDSYFFDAGDHKVVFLREEMLRYAAGDTSASKGGHPFLPAAFQITRYPDTPDTMLQLEPGGAGLTPLRTVLIAETEAYYELTDGDVIDEVSLATLESDLPELFNVTSG